MTQYLFNLNKKKCIVITTINRPTEAVIKFSEIGDYDLIIVCDKKTNIDTYKNTKCILLTLEKQKEEFPKLYDILPFNHYCRKNMGYLYAIKYGYDLIYETDDDNIPYDTWKNFENFDGEIINISNSKFINIYNFFTDIHIWPRGYPLNKILEKNTEHNINKEYNIDDVAIIQGLVDNDPDVDAIFRLTSTESKTNIIFDKSNKLYKIGLNSYCPANTQNTFWINRSFFYLLYIPSFINFRFCDILKMYIAQKFINNDKYKLCFSGSFVYQDRNIHNLLDDFKDECDMYIQTEQFIKILDNLKINNNYDDFINLYEILLENKIIKNQNEIEIIKIWIETIKTYLDV